MSRKFKTVDYEKALEITVTLRDCLPPDHLVRFIVGAITKLDLSSIYAKFGSKGGEPYAPEILLGLIFYGYATGVFGSRKIEKATRDSMPFYFIAGGMHPDHDTIANFRKVFLPEIKKLYVQILVMAKEVGILNLENVSQDGSKIHADASKSKAVSYKRLLELENKLSEEADELFSFFEQADPSQLPEGLNIAEEIAFRQVRLTNLAQAKVVIEARAEERYQIEKAEYDAKMRERKEKAKKTGRKPRGRTPQEPTPGPRDKDQYNFTDPESRIMKNSTDNGMDQHYNVQLAVDQESYLVVANTLSNHPNDYAEAIPTLDAIPVQVGTPKSTALDNGYFSKGNIKGIKARGVEPYIATGREPHHKSWRTWFDELPAPPSENASPKEKMARKLQTEIGKAIYRLRKSTVEPVIGTIKETLGFRQFSLRGLIAAAGEWCLVCLAYNLKRMHALMGTI